MADQQPTGSENASSTDRQATCVRIFQFAYSPETILEEATHFQVDLAARTLEVVHTWKKGEDASGARALLEAQAVLAEIAASRLNG